MKKRMIVLVFALAVFAIPLSGTVSWAANSEKCEPEGPFLILNDQSYALCATAACFSFNQLAYCKCDVLRGDSISVPFDYGDDENICTLNQQGKKNGYRASTFSFPADVTYPDGKLALYTCPGEANKDKYVNPGHPARGSYAQCDGGLCFTSTRGKSFPGFDDRLRKKEIMCSCPFATICEKMSEDPEGYQISGPYDGGCDPAACESCNAAALTEAQCETPNPVSLIGIEENVPVGAPAGTPEILSCLLLGDGNVPNSNSCFCQCNSVDENKICTDWTVVDESPLEAFCN